MRRYVRWTLLGLLALLIIGAVGFVIWAESTPPPTAARITPKSSGISKPFFFLGSSIFSTSAMAHTILFRSSSF